MSRKFSILCVLSLLFLFAADSWGHAIITRMSDKQVISLTEFTAAASGSDVILMGESHDNKDHHDLQLEVMRSLFAKNVRLSIGLEMIEAGYQRQLDEWIAGRMTEAAMERIFEMNWSGWELYRDIFLFARDNHIPMVALNVPAQIVKKVAHSGFASLTAEEKKGLPEGTKCDLRNPQMAMLKRMFQSSSNHVGDGKIFNNFCEAQTVRNTGMAIRASSYLSKHPGEKMLILTGIWHAEKHAIPELIERNGRTLSSTVILPESPELNRDNSDVSETDYLVDL
ncbi:ChaN family lipoprotein [Geomonas sp. RF6]|uniref:ChaN family lipoprotein n=1 Tax=Geomonas sp. RF6 TaxID=2897342 RepID=UPI001E58C9DE|nr:ChaN family lipoprotein [Geomonas sp. RF6]UFS71447.1 ChaN family lipoprotein [Geomonas sp. RF6]